MIAGGLVGICKYRKYIKCTVPVIEVRRCFHKWLSVWYLANWNFIVMIIEVQLLIFFKGSRGEQERLLRTSTTLYIGNLSFYTTEEQIYELFSKCGDVKRIIMGLDKFKKTPCGFCFVEYPLYKQVKLIYVITPQLCWKVSIC